MDPLAPPPLQPKKKEEKSRAQTPAIRTDFSRLSAQLLQMIAGV